MSDTSTFDPAFALRHPATVPAARMFANRRRSAPRPGAHVPERRAAARAMPQPAEPAVTPLFKSRAVTLSVELFVSAALWVGVVKLAVTLL